MRILIIIGIIMFIFALANWIQSQGYFENFFRLFRRKSANSSSGETTVNSTGAGSTDASISGVSGGNGVIINNSAFAFDEDYAYDDDLDYFDEF